jgi:hypothetical protein
LWFSRGWRCTSRRRRGCQSLPLWNCFGKRRD